MKILGRIALTAFAVVGLAGSASSQVRYHAAPPTEQFYLNSPYDESYGTSPSYVISSSPYGPAVRVVERCQYPDGWNVTDFSRDVNGIPNGIDHTCPVRGYGRLRSRY